MTRVRRKRLKRIGFLLTYLMLGLWFFSVMFELTYWFRGQGAIALGGAGRIYFAIGPVTNVGWECRRTTVFRKMSWTRNFAYLYLGFALPGKTPGILNIPVWLFVVATGFPTAFFWWRDRHPKAGFCRNCSYDLTGNESGVCPECGTAIKGADPPP